MASNLLSRYNRSFRKKVQTEHPEEAHPLDIYKNAMEEGDYMEVPFDYASEDGSLSFTDKNGIRIVITAESLYQAMPYYDPHIKDKFLAGDFSVKIDHIDEKAGIVYVKSSRDTAHSTRAIISSEIRKQIEQAEKVDEKTGKASGDYPVVYGTVVSIKDDTVYVNILDRGVLGLCNVKYWSQGWTTDIHDSAEIGKAFEFQAVGIVTTKSKTEEARRQTGARGTMFLLNREGVTMDPWKRSALNGLKENDVMLIKCVRRPEKERFWWGLAKNVPDLQIMCDYNQNLPVSIGRYYKCKVTRFDPERHILQAVPFFETDEGLDERTLNNLRIIKNNKAKNKR